MEETSEENCKKLLQNNQTTVTLMPQTKTNIIFIIAKDHKLLALKLIHPSASELPTLDPLELAQKVETYLALGELDQKAYAEVVRLNEALRSHDNQFIHIF
jgi:hypothetical protein